MFNRIIKIPQQKSFFLFGPRGTGKSTLLRNVFPQGNSLWYDLLHTDTYTRLLAHPELIREEVLSRNPQISYVIIDEVQRIPELLNEVHWLSEQPNSPSFILTGSSARKLKTKKANMLGGRALTLQLFPLTVEELENVFSLQKVLQFGALPKMISEKTDEEKADRLQAYVDTYLKEEIQWEAQIRNLAPFVQFLSLAAEENGHQINYSNIAHETGVHYLTVKGFFQILEDTLIGFMLYPYSKSIRKRLSKHPKFYFFDPGVRRALTRKLSVPLQPFTKEYGEAFEHFIILEIMRMSIYKKWGYRFSFYRTSAGAEVDMIIESPTGRIMALEIKSSQNPAKKDFSGLKSFQKVCPSAEAYCVSSAPHRRTIGHMTILPWQEMFDVIRPPHVQ